MSVARLRGRSLAAAVLFGLIVLLTADRKAGQARFLLSSMEWIKPEQMSVMKPVDVKTRDGMLIHGYLTVPAGSDGKNLPLVVNPHGGPHGPRDEWGFNPEVQLLANRGW